MAEQDITPLMWNQCWRTRAGLTTRGTRYDGIVGRRMCVVLAEEHATPRVITVFWYDEGRNR